MKTAIMIAVLCAAILLPTGVSATPDADRTLFYYGWPSSFNYQMNWWSPDNVAQDMGQYDMVVLGAGLEATSHPDHANTAYIISQMPDTEVYGYVTLNQPEVTTHSKIAQWNAMGVAGIFLDEAGYDFGTPRAEFNRVVTTIHVQPSANTAFVNAWNPDHVMGTANDVSYPNSAYNPGTVASAITSDDFYLLESCPVYNNVYRMSDYDVAKCNKCVALRNVYGVNLVSVSTIGNTHPTGQTLYNQHVAISDLYGFDAQGTSDIWYGAGSSQVKMWS